MPHSTKTSNARQTTKAEKARQYLKTGAVTRDDSDDELGYEDHPWEWIYDSQQDTRQKEDELSHDQETLSGDEYDTLSQDERRSKRMHMGRPRLNHGHRIIGARMGSFECKVGDCVLLKAEGNNEAWVGIICEFLDDEEDGMIANFMWFSTEKEIRNKEKKRSDFMPIELYITPSWDFNPLASINGKANISSPEVFRSKYPSGKIPRNSPDFGKTFVCRRGCNTRTATYTEEFIWEEIYHGAEEDIYKLIERVKDETHATRKKRTTRHDLPEDDFAEGESREAEADRPVKKRKVSAPSTPRKQQTSSKVTTPGQKRVVIKRPLEFTPLGTRILSPGNISSSPFQMARSKLHVSAVPATLPCREAEFSEVYSHMESAISDGSGTCIYISGTPGTGKTATVREVVAQLNNAVLAEELDDFIFVEINGMKVTDPHQSYSLLWEALKGDRVSPSQALDLLEREFSHPSPRRIPCVVLMDELDQLVTKNQSVMYNFFNWPSLRHSRLIVLAVANTMDLPERTLSNKISSRLGLTRITFPGYNHEQLMKIIQSRLEGVPGGIVESDAIQFASRKVAAVSGDARRALDICRRAVELAEMESEFKDALSPTLKRDIPDHANTPTSSKPPKKVTIATIKRAINEATSSPLQQHLRGLPLSSKMLLAAMLARFRRTGLRESVLGEIIEETKKLSAMTTQADAVPYLLRETPLSAEGRLNVSKPRNLPRMFSIGTAATELMQAGIIGMETRKGDRTGKIRLCIGEGDVKQALKDDAEVRGLGF